MLPLELRTESDQQTRALGQRIGIAARPGDVVCLNGELGAGKTTFTQGIAEGLGIGAREVTSPTYALIAEHTGGRIALYHMDAYRLNESSELSAIGFDEYLLAADGLFVIEWASRVQDALPDDRLEIELRHTDPIESRQIIATAFGSIFTALLREATQTL